VGNQGGDMNKDEKPCLDCGRDLRLTNYPYYQIKYPVKPKAQPNRWKVIGYKCEDCYDKKS
jgi:hypothetical protein